MSVFLNTGKSKSVDIVKIARNDVENHYLYGFALMQISRICLYVQVVSLVVTVSCTLPLTSEVEWENSRTQRNVQDVTTGGAQG